MKADESSLVSYQEDDLFLSYQGPRTVKINAEEFKEFLEKRSRKARAITDGPSLFAPRDANPVGGCREAGLMRDTRSFEEILAARLGRKSHKNNQESDSEKKESTSYRVSEIVKFSPFNELIIVEEKSYHILEDLYVTFAKEDVVDYNLYYLSVIRNGDKVESMLLTEDQAQLFIINIIKGAEQLKYFLSEWGKSTVKIGDWKSAIKIADIVQQVQEDFFKKTLTY